MTHRWVLLALFALLSTGPALRAAAAPLTPLTPEEASVKRELTRLVRQEDKAILAGDERRLRAVFLPGGRAGQALQEAKERQRFLRAWSQARGLRLLSVRVSLRTPQIAFPTRDSVRVFAVVSEAYTYHYLPEGQEGRFGLGIRHDYLLARQKGRLRIRADYFTDPLDQDTRIPAPAQPESGRELPAAIFPQAHAPLEQPAAAYADRFCGAAPGCGNHGLYNERYANYNGEGGDCTNFVSQSLEAGGFREGGDWSYDRQAGEGSRAWSNAAGLRDYLEGSDRARIFARGTYAGLTRPSGAFPHGAAYALRIGDLISYIERGRVVHTAIVTAFDQRGVPLVDTHTSDRYHVPWDLGWDRATRYLLWRVRYPAPHARRTAPGGGRAQERLRAGTLSRPRPPAG